MMLEINIGRMGGLFRKALSVYRVPGHNLQLKTKIGERVQKSPYLTGIDAYRGAFLVYLDALAVEVFLGEVKIIDKEFNMVDAGSMFGNKI